MVSRAGELTEKKNRFQTVIRNSLDAATTETREDEMIHLELVQDPAIVRLAVRNRFAPGQEEELRKKQLTSQNSPQFPHDSWPTEILGR